MHIVYYEKYIFKNHFLVQDIQSQKNYFDRIVGPERIFLF